MSDDLFNGVEKGRAADPDSRLMDDPEKYGPDLGPTRARIAAFFAGALAPLTFLAGPSPTTAAGLVAALLAAMGGSKSNRGRIAALYGFAGLAAGLLLAGLSLAVVVLYGVVA